MAISKAFGYIVQCDQKWANKLDTELKELNYAQCMEKVLVLVHSHSGKYGGKEVIEGAQKQGFLYDSARKLYSCPKCFQFLNEHGKASMNEGEINKQEEGKEDAKEVSELN